MKLNIVLPWILVLGLAAGFGAVFVKGNAKDAELAKLREQTREIEQMRTELAAAQEQAKISEDQVLVPRKDKDELIRLRGEVGKLRTDNQAVTRELATLKARADAARAQASDAMRDAEAARAQANAAIIANQPAPRDAQRDACINNLRQLDGAKQQWALEFQKTAETVPAAQDVLPYLKNNALPKCFGGGSYTLNAVGQAPNCSIPGHVVQ